MKYNPSLHFIFTLVTLIILYYILHLFTMPDVISSL